MLFTSQVVAPLSGGTTGGAVCTEIGVDSADDPAASRAATANV